MHMCAEREGLLRSIMVVDYFYSIFFLPNMMQRGSAFGSQIGSDDLSVDVMDRRGPSQTVVYTLTQDSLT